MTSGYLLRSHVKADSSLQKAFTPPLSDRRTLPWFHLNELYSMWNHDGYTLVLEETYRNSVVLQDKKWSQIKVWNCERNTKLRELYMNMRRRWGHVQCAFDVLYRFPPIEKREERLYIQKIRCQHLRHKVDIHIDGLIHPSLLPFPSQETSYLLVGIQTNSEWKEYQDLKYQTLLQYTSCFQHLWCASGYFVYHVDKDTWIWKARREDLQFSIARMIRRIRKSKRYASWYIQENDVERLPSYMLPNMKLQRDVWKDQKREKAERMGELTLLWNITDKQRQLLWSQGFYSWKQPSFDVTCLPFLGSWKKEVLHRILQINQQSEYSIGKRKEFCRTAVASLASETWNHVFLDFEYSDQKYIYLTGVFDPRQNQYHGFWTDSMEKDQEPFVLEKVIEFLRSRSPVRVWYWHVDGWMWDQKCRQYPSLHTENDTDSIEWYDLCSLIRNTMAFRGCFDFSLKNIIRALHRAGMIEESYEDLAIQTGEESLSALEDYWKTGSREVKKSLESYNRMDCVAVYRVFDQLFHQKDYLEFP